MTIKWVFTLFASIFHVSQFWDVQTVLCTYFELCKPFHSIRVNFDCWPISSLRQFFDFSDFEFSIFKFTWKEWRNLIYFNTLFLRWFRSINSKMIWNERKSFESIIKYGHYSRIRFNFRHAMMEFFGMLWVTSKEF